MHPYFDIQRPIVIGHRGCSGEAPENTLPAFERALEQGAQILESDVHATRDGVAVLAHDPAVDRMTESSGAIADLDLAELQALDAGHRFERDGRFPFRGRGVRIPTLEQAFTALPQARFNLEIKADAPGLVEQVVELVGKLARAELTLLTAENDAIQARLRDVMRATGTRPALGASRADVLEFVRAAVAGEAPESDSMALQIPTEFIGRPLVTPELVAHAHAHDVQVHAWTINDEAEMSRLLELGVDGIVTDYPGRMARLLGRGE